MLLPFKSNKPEKNQENSETPKRRNPSRVRDHLANERTYLAWMRTAISLMGFGVVIVRLRFFKPPITTTPGNGWKLGLIFSLVGLATVLLSTSHYFAVRHDIDDDTYEPPDRWVILFSITVVLLGAGIIYYVFALPLNSINTLVFE
ncbi:MAG: YidH family protein [Waterburya sp.]